MGHRTFFKLKGLWGPQAPLTLAPQTRGRHEGEFLTTETKLNRLQVNAPNEEVREELQPVERDGNS